MSGTEVALVEEGKYALEASSEIARNQREELGDDFVPKFERISVPGAGSTNWELPGGDAAKEITGVIVAQRKTTALYLDENDESKFPDAYSLDGKTQILAEGTVEKAARLGIPVPLTNLAKCPYYQWDSKHLIGGSGKGKATREYREIYIVQPGTVFPTLVKIPSTSLVNSDSHFNALVQKAPFSLSGYESILTLEKKEQGQVKWSVVNFKVGDKLDDTSYLAAKELGKQVRAVLSQAPAVVEVSTTEVEGFVNSGNGAVSVTTTITPDPVPAGVGATDSLDDPDF